MKFAVYALLAGAASSFDLMDVFNKAGQDKIKHEMLDNFDKVYKPISDQVKNAVKKIKGVVHKEEEQLLKVDPEFNMDFEQIVEKNGYEFHTYPVHTEDGYILNLYRITTAGYSGNDKPAVFLQHGITDSADCWIMHKPEFAPAFRLLQEGYDVWLGNQRGTKHSLSPGHETLDPKTSADYWAFSFTEMGDYDAPAQVDYIRKSTGQAKIAYIGHSQGTSQMFYALSAREDFWAERLNLFASLAPVTALQNTKSELFKYVSPLGGSLKTVLAAVHVYELLGDSFTSGAMKIVCGFFEGICQFGEGFLITQDPSLDDPDRFQVYMAHFPAGASVQSFVHYGQLITDKKFELFDWGKETNQKKYGQDTPPEVDLTKITGKVPLAMFVGTADDLGDTTDARWARDQIQKGGDAIKLYKEVPAGHSTFMIGKDMSYVDDLLNVVKQYSSQ